MPHLKTLTCFVKVNLNHACFYPGDLLQLMLSESRQKYSTGEYLPNYVVSLSDRDDWIMNKGYWSYAEALHVFSQILQMKIVEVDECLKLGLEF